MSSTYRFLVVLTVFALAAMGTIWFSADAHERNASASFAELDASDILLNSMLIRESALRGFAQTRKAALLAPYSSAGVILATDLKVARSYADPGDGKTVEIEAMTRLSRQWGRSADAAIVAIRRERIDVVRLRSCA